MGKYNCGDYMTGMDENYVYYLVSRNLKRIRKEKGLTQEKLAELSNYSVGFIMNIESEKYYQTFSLGTLWQFGKSSKCRYKRVL